MSARAHVAVEAAWSGPHRASRAALRGPLFGLEPAEAEGGGGGGGGGAAQGGAWLDPLLSQLAAAAALLMEHVITPPSSPLLDAPYAERVAFHIYVVSYHQAEPLTLPPTLTLTLTLTLALTLALIPSPGE